MMKLYSEEYISILPADPKTALYDIAGVYLAEVSSAKINGREVGYDIDLEAYVMAETIINANELDISIPLLLSVTETQKSEVIYHFIVKLSNDLEEYVSSNKEAKTLQNLRSEFSIHVGKSFAYEFSDGDLKRIQYLINDLRELVRTSEEFEGSHKSRLLKRLERLQAEMHKKQSDLDQFWGLVGDAGVVLGKFGKNAKPFVDRIKEITNIVWRTQARSEELPSDSKPALLSNKSEA